MNNYTSKVVKTYLILNDNVPNPYTLGGSIGPSILEGAVLEFVKNKAIGSIFSNAPVNANVLDANRFWGGDMADVYGEARFFFASFPKTQRWQYYQSNIPRGLIGIVDIPAGGEIPAGATPVAGTAQNQPGKYYVPSPADNPKARVVKVKINRRRRVALSLTLSQLTGLIVNKAIESKIVSAEIDSQIHGMDGEILSLLYASAFSGGELARFINIGTDAAPNWKWLFANDSGHPFYVWYNTGDNKNLENIPESVTFANAAPIPTYLRNKTVLLNKGNFVAVAGDGNKKWDLIRGIGYTIIPQLNPFGPDNSDEWQTVRTSSGNIVVPGLSEIQSKLVAQINLIQQYFSNEVMGVDLNSLGIIADLHFNNKLIKGGSWSGERYRDEKSNSYGGAIAGVKYKTHPFLGTKFDNRLYHKDMTFDFSALSAIMYHWNSACFLINDVRTALTPDVDGGFYQFTANIFYGYGLLRPELIRAVFHKEPIRRPVEFDEFNLAGGGTSPGDGSTTFPDVKTPEDRSGPYPENQD